MAAFWRLLCTVNWAVGVLLLSADKPVAAANSGPNADKLVAAANSGPNAGECQRYPRFLAARKGSTVHFYCSCGSQCAPHHVQLVKWFKGTANGSLLETLEDDRQCRRKTNQPYNNSCVTISKIRHSDNGIYYCKLQIEKELILFCGTELRVLESLKTKSTLKDAIILIQTILIVVFLAVPMLLVIDKNNRPVQRDEDHTYEGLKIEETATYEDIVAYQVSDAKWIVGDQSCVE